MITTTLNRIRSHSPCETGWKTLLAHLGKTKADDEPLPYGVIVESNGLDDALWCCRAEPQYDKAWRLFAVWCARQVQYLMTDSLSIAALDVAERHAHGNATDQELSAAGDAASAASWATANAAAWATTNAAAGDAASNTARATARATANAAAMAAQKAEFLRIVGDGLDIHLAQDLAL